MPVPDHTLRSEDLLQHQVLTLAAGQSYLGVKKIPEVWVSLPGILMSCRVPAPDNGSLKTFPAAALPSTPVSLGNTFQLKPPSPS